MIEQVPPGTMPGLRRERTAHVLFLCPACDPPVKPIAGKELILRSIEIEEDEE